MRMTIKMTALTAATVAATVLLAGCASSSTSSAETPDSQSAASGAVVATGSDADITFAQLMIPHHEQAVQMADMALQQATSPEVTDLATQIKAAQDPEIQQMRDASGADFDRMWLTMMIAHHEGAIEMAEQVKAQSTNPDVTALADAIVAGQTTEIDTMQQLLDN